MAKRYRVIGPRPVFEHGPGEEFRRELSHGQEKALLGVHLAIVEEPKPTSAPTAQPEPKKPAPKRRTKPQSPIEE